MQPVQHTNDYSIASKCSVEQRRYPGAGAVNFFLPFVHGKPRRAPALNRGYWTRTVVVRQAVQRFLSHCCLKPRAVVNLGAGFDPLAFQLLHDIAEVGDTRAPTVSFYDVDFEPLIQHKQAILAANPWLLPSGARSCGGSCGAAHAAAYHTVACDLRDLDLLTAQLARHGLDFGSTAVLFVSEVAAVYMPLATSDRLVRWAARFPDAHACFLEQILPVAHHPFADKMLAHFARMGSPLHSPARYPTLPLLTRRWTDAGWADVQVLDLAAAYDTLIPEAYKAQLAHVELFDEWHELSLFLQHYALQLASTTALAGRRSAAPPGPLIDRSPTPPAPHTVVLRRRECAKQLDLRAHASCVYEAADGNTRILSVGGYGASNVRNGNAFVFSSADPSAPPHVLAAPPPPRVCLCAVPLEPRTCLVFGGRTTPAKALDDCYLLCGDEWTELPRLPHPSFHGCAVPVKAADGEWYVVVQAGKPSGGFFLWTLRTRAWSLLRCTAPELEALWGTSMHYSHTLRRGLLIGGRTLTDDPAYAGVWEWTLRPTTTAASGSCPFVLHATRWELPSTAVRLVSRIGARTSVLGVKSDDTRPLFVGGTQHDHPLSPDELFVLIDMQRRTVERVSARMDAGEKVEDEFPSWPLLVDFQAVSVSPNKLLLLGGGCNAFSFGSLFNNGLVEVTLEEGA
ncbi:leucine carboxyl methyltransferase [Schizosaccharomyces japonicus yFS275]|uniref:tRNA wybutosine-synthesizing protein 4 n=1 Tax=Schizosaccharomyces japonicus (strain yFS275 / FY16936) TaxID=402676 RepID=B6K070_SCHJY|nr:leucine carboxyl methyltransferase [Schizosaccharomyces japonicus yFS275]EEB06220.2 leucine carboxyl methyltransferase [Schizosaccharomyces japonicus yFS275]